jgi:asparagine synthase (glutamine-hydrolysing)
VPTLLRNYDRYSMMNGVEIRMPFMDHRLISYAFSLPWQSKLKNGYTKFIIRDALKDFMPDEITWRKSKIGFQTPILQYIQGPWKDYFSDTINSTGFKTSVLVDHNLAKNKLNKILTSENVTYQDAKDLWMQTIPYFWEQSFLKRIG